MFTNVQDQRSPYFVVIALGGLVVIVFAVGPEVRGSDLSEDDF
jgi:hypothetical protein